MATNQDQGNSEGKKEGLSTLQMLGIGFIGYATPLILLFLDQVVFGTNYSHYLPMWMLQVINVIYFPFLWIYFTLFQ